MGWFEEKRAAEATVGLRSQIDPTLRVLWNDLLRRYVVAQDWRLTPQRENAFRKLETQGFLLGCQQLRVEHPNGMIPYLELFLLDFKGRAVEPEVGLIAYCLPELAPYDWEKAERESDVKVEAAREAEWRDRCGEDATAKEMAANARHRKHIFVGT